MKNREAQQKLQTILKFASENLNTNYASTGREFMHLIEHEFPKQFNQWLKQEFQKIDPRNEMKLLDETGEPIKC